MELAYNQAALATLARRHDLEFVALFGSHATGATHAKSDVDIAVISRKNVDRARLAVALDELFDRDDTEVIDLASASPTLMYAVARDGRVLHEEEEGAFARWCVYAAKIWMDTAWLRSFRDRMLQEWSAAHILPTA